MILNSPVTQNRRIDDGFSLIELLTTIAVLGIMVTLGLTFFGGSQRDATLRIRGQRNAQEIVSMASSASAAGADFVVEGNKKATVEKLITGVSPERGVFKGKIFRVGTMDPDALQGALPFVDLNGDQLVYDNSGN